MRKWLAIFGLLLVAPVCAEKPLPVNGGRQQQQPQNQTHAPNPATPQPCTSDVCKENAENTERYAYYKAHPEEYLKAAIAPANLSNWILAALGAIGGLLAILTLLAIKKQANIMERQAKDARDSGAEAARIALATAKAAQASAAAALKTVQVMIDSERPWLVAHFKGENESCLRENGSVSLKWEVKNVGKSPARLIEAGARLILDTIEPGWTNPSDFGRVDSLDGRILVPGDCVSFYPFWSKTENGILRTATGKRREDFNDLVVGYGFVKYRSTVGEGEDLIARFCECASIDAGVISGPFDIWEFAGEEYLRCT